MRNNYLFKQGLVANAQQVLAFCNRINRNESPEGVFSCIFLKNQVGTGLAIHIGVENEKYESVKSNMKAKR